MCQAPIYKQSKQNLHIHDLVFLSQDRNYTFLFFCKVVFLMVVGLVLFVFSNTAGCIKLRLLFVVRVLIRCAKGAT